MIDAGSNQDYEDLDNYSNGPEKLPLANKIYPEAHAPAHQQAFSDPHQSHLEPSTSQLEKHLSIAVPTATHPL